GGLEPLPAERLWRASKLHLPYSTTFSEAPSHSTSHVRVHNKTLKYCPVFPERFGSLAEAETFCHHFFGYYNHEHYHAGLGLHTPFTVHIGTAPAIQDRREQMVERFRTANPHRFTRTPRLPKIPTVAYINQPEEDQNSASTPAQEAA
ncbi:integrase core domain-containing protein, partial [Nonomuraea sp. 3N208]|uniref:integrase core domain-containing protein n=1 Tax=Nonomuraea sp. 3N208 TaxID=3457421 RepID=UPI003FCE35DE